MSVIHSFRTTAAALLMVGLSAVPAMANDWLKAKHPHLVKTTENAVTAADGGNPGAAAGSIEAWQKAKTPALFPTAHHVLETSAEQPKADSIEAWKQAKFPHLRKTTRN